jgi:hypothetical protein
MLFINFKLDILAENSIDFSNTLSRSEIQFTFLHKKNIKQTNNIRVHTQLNNIKLCQHRQ